MTRKSILIDIALFIIIVALLLIVIPLISSIFKKLIFIEVIIVLAGAVGLRFLVQKIRGKLK